MRLAISVIVLLVCSASFAVDLPTKEEMDERLKIARHAERNRLGAVIEQARSDLKSLARNKALNAKAKRAELTARIQQAEQSQKTVLDPDRNWTPVRYELKDIRRGDVFNLSLVNGAKVYSVLDPSSAIVEKRFPLDRNNIHSTATERYVLNNVDTSSWVDGKLIRDGHRVVVLGTRKELGETIWELWALDGPVK